MLQRVLLIFLLLLRHGLTQEPEVDYDWPLDEESYEQTNPAATAGLLYPFESETRDVRSLDGIWQFYKSNISDPMQGVREKWYKSELQKLKPTIAMPVPASYNDLTTDSTLRDHVGTVWYERKFFVPQAWARGNQRVWLRFGSVHYAAIVWLNGVQLMQHQIGHLPFEVDISYNVMFGVENRVTVLCDNTLLNSTIPQGKLQHEASDHGQEIVQSYTFDFFNYAGIHRSVHLYTTPKQFIQDIQISTDIAAHNVGIINYQITANSSTSHKNFYYLEETQHVIIQVLNKSGEMVANHTSDATLSGSIKIANVLPWWPYLMHARPAHLYTMVISLYDADDSLLDIYRLKVGIRTLKWNNASLLINDKPVYLRGFGRHEDSDLRGKGLDYTLLTRDFNLIKWIGANAYRTSHYPYSEESMQFADEQGIMIIDECPSVNTDIFTSELLHNHKSALEQLIHRDRNHASVIMWSVANEPRTASNKSGFYFGNLTEYVRTLDTTRPLTASINADATKDFLAQHLDIISFNRYNAWYQNAGHLDMITNYVVNEASAWNKKHNKPVLMSEYGADTMEGLHFLPAYIWSEDYQSLLFSHHFKAFDILRMKSWFIGEFVWNFADFKTEQTYTRVGGNKKGIFTRNRQPKSSAFLLRQRYYALAMHLGKTVVPDDLFNYIINWNDDVVRDEL